MDIIQNALFHNHRFVLELFTDRQKGWNQMKKTIAILLVVCLCVGMCACGTERNDAPEANEPKSIELTSDNISQYLGIKIGKPADIDEQHHYGTTAIEFYPLQPGDFSNVAIELFIKDFDGNISSVVGSESWDDENKQVIPFLLPSDGRYSIEVTIYDYWYDRYKVEEVEFQNVSGLFTPH